MTQAPIPEPGCPVQALRLRLLQFAQARDWLQFHSPKNLASALVVEAGELLEPFQWLDDAQSRQLPPDLRDAVSAEMADVFIYLLQLSTALDVDLLAAAQRKIDLNEQRYPVHLARGHNRKHDQLQPRPTGDTAPASAGAPLDEGC